MVGLDVLKGLFQPHVLGGSTETPKEKVRDREPESKSCEQERVGKQDAGGERDRSADRWSKEKGDRDGGIKKSSGEQEREGPVR